MFRILLSEPIEAAGMAALQGKAEVVISPDPSNETVGRLLRDADALILRTATKVTRAMIAASPRLKVISRTGGGLNNVDIDAATEYGVVVAGVKGPQDRYVAEHAIALIMALSKQLPYLDAQTRKGNFKSRFEYKPMGVEGKTLGLVGFGRIGKIVATVAQVLGMEVLAYDPYLKPEQLQGSGIRLVETPEALLKVADFVSLHVPSTPETEKFINAKRLALMKPGAFLINTARGEIVDEGALVEALKSGRLAGAGLDVLAQEPPDPNSPLMGMQSVILSPHTAGLTREGVALLAKGAAENALAVLESKAPSFSGNWDELKGRIGR
ncbi:D-3-phosphoglycerate dehydrogenase [bioreactor metagenome]|uniref:D-3-phosphoglycerate dehydrogenase n=1 Tax=bioreactor metagenome TaxID=1076179 RepID=A0A644SYX2_9ZZZZ|nr:hydroxyacid dehydrogenase [Spirochaetales bacterium]NLX44979.1 hydroxyacid dehydrogenase [Treponema sp.]HOI22865.1 hydroxyacid dehydrogenase [Spirochaetales bacterium]